MRRKPANKAIARGAIKEIVSFFQSILVVKQRIQQDNCLQNLTVTPNTHQFLSTVCDLDCQQLGG